MALDDYPTISNDPSIGAALPEEDIGGYSAPVNPSDIEASRGYDWAPGGLATITAPTRPIDVETQREIDFLHEPVPSDEEAGFLYERLPFLSDADRPAALRSLNRYAADQENKEAQVRQTERQRTFLDPKARTEWMNRKDVKENLGYLDDANAAYDRMAARKFFEEVIAKRPLSDPEYEAQRNDYARMKVGKAKVSDQEVFGIIQKEVEKEKEYDAATEFARGEMLLQKVKAAAEKKPFRKGDVWDSARKMIPAEGPDGLESSLYQEVSRFDAVTEERLRRNMPALGVMYSYMMRKAGAAPTAQMVGWTDSPEQRKEFIDSVLSIPDEDMDEALHTLQAAITHGQVDKTIPQKMWHDFGKMIAEVSGLKPVFKDMSESARDIDIEAMRNLVNTGQVKSDASGNLVWNPAPTPGRTEERLQPMSAEQKAQALKGLDDLQKLNLMDYRLRRMFDETLGKKEEYFSQKFAGGGPLAVERAVYSGLEQLPQMGLAAINAPMYLAVVGSRSYLDIIDANPKIDRTVAFSMSATEASINWITDRAQLKGLGGLGGVRQLLTLTRKIPLGRPLTRWIGTSIYETGTEYVQDYLSEVGKRAVQEILHAINPDLSVGHIKTFNEINDEFVKNLGPTAGTMFFLSAISAGAMTWRDVKDPQSTVYNHGHLKSLGLHEDDITTLLYETDFDARDRMLQQLAAERTPEQKNDGILYAQQMAEAEKAKIVGETTTVGATAMAAGAGTTTALPPGITIIGHDATTGAPIYSGGIGGTLVPPTIGMTVHGMGPTAIAAANPGVITAMAPDLVLANGVHVKQVMVSWGGKAPVITSPTALRLPPGHPGLTASATATTPGITAMATATGTTATEQFKEPRLEPHAQPDGTRKFTLYDANGTVVRKDMDEGVANAEYNDLVRTSFGEYLQKQIEARQTEEAEAKGVAAETKWNILSAQEKTTLGNILEYEYVKQPTPEQQKGVEGLKRALGKPGSDIVAVSVDQPTTRAGKQALNFVRWFEDTFKKQVVFVASASGESLSFDGAVNSSDPNTIFLNAAGNRNVLSLLGHEWSHTLEKTNPKLWKDVMERMQPMIMDWAVQVGKVDASYDPEERTKEFVANVIGDAFGDPEFWKMVRAKDANLFQRMLQAVQDWFDTVIEHASEWGTQDIAKDLKGLRELVSEAMKTAEAGPEEVTGPTEITPEMHAGLKAAGFDDAQIAGLTPKQAAYYLEKPTAQMSVRLHHGSGVKDIVKWVTDYLGSGEGHIAFGWGLYMAEHPEVARRYRRLLGGEEKVLTAGKEKYDTSNPLHVAAYWLATFEIQGMSRDQAAAQALVAHKGVRLGGGPSIQTPQRNAALKALDILQSATDPNADSLVKLHAIPDFRIETVTGGALYTLDADITRAQALDLDRRMNDQSPYVMEKIAASGIDYDPNVSGEKFQKMLLKRYYEEMLREKWRSDPNHPVLTAEKQAEFEGKKRVSMFLKGIGIPANTFADGFSRKQWLYALHDHYEAIAALEEDLRQTQRYSHTVSEAVVRLNDPITEIQAEIQVLKDGLLDQRKALGITNNWVIWEPERLKNAPEGERLQFAASRESGHKFSGRGQRQVDENGGYVTPAEETKVDTSINALLTKAGHKGAKRKRLFEKARAQVLADIRSRRAANPDVNTGAADPWDTMSVTGTDLEVLGEKEEDVKATAIWQKQGYRFDQVPEGMTRDQWKVELSNLVMAQFIERLQKGTAPGATKEQRAGAQLILKEIEWYRDFTVRLRQDFGGAADFMADLLGAFSPRQNVRLNVRNAIDAIWAIHTGKYDQLFKDLDAYLKADPTRTIKTWRKDDGRMMKARSGNLFGTNTELGMTAALGLWREIKAMDAPKAKNFTRNLIGLSIKATIDVWAARLLDRVGGKPRIPVDAETGVAGNHITEGQFKKLIQAEANRIEETGSNQASPELLDLLEGNIPVTGQFAFGQEVFARVAELMRDPATWAGTGLSQEIIDKFKDVTPADVQAMNWFLEKEIWTENDWTNEEGAGGSFLHEIEQHLGTRFQFGLTQATKTWVPNDPDQAQFIADVHADLISAMPEVLALRIMDSFGMYKGDKERSLDLEFTTSPGMEPNDIMRIALKHASSKGQEATHISRVMEDWEEDGPNDRPGVEIYLKAGSELSALDPVMKVLEARGLNGFTLIVDSRAKMGSDEYIGVRLQYVPEYSKDGPNWAKQASKVEKAIQKALRNEIKALPEVLYAKLVWYDTIVFQENIDYDKEGPNSGALGTVEARSWRRRYFDYMAKKAVRRDEREKLLESQHPADVPAREPTEGPTGVAPPETVPVTAFDKDAGTFVPTPMKPTKELLKILRVEQRTYNELLKCLAA